jgi:hypothetical protein
MATWFARRVVDLVGKLSDLYYSRKYGAMARRLGRPGIPPDDQPGFILIQIDGLSYDYLVQAVAAGYMPYVGRLLADGRLTVAPWRCGLPSSTPAVQAGMMYGNRFDIPGFRWYEKDRSVTMTPQRLDQISIVVDRISRGQRGILSGGSCYVSMFDGDADLALFTLSTLRRQRFFESVRGVGLFVLFLLSPFRVLRVLGLAGVNYLRGLSQRLTRFLKPLDRSAREPDILNPFDVVSPLLYAASDALFTEVQTFGVMLDIYRCVPAIYANYNSYDEVAHEMGPDDSAAFRVLRAVDKRIHQIDRMRAHYRRREYDLYLMSDHGNTPAVPFSWQNGNTLGHHIVAQVDDRLSLHERVEPHTHLSKRARYLREELRALEKTASPRLRKIVTSARRYVDQRVEDAEALDYDLQRQKDIVVSVSGPLAHIYFNVSSRQLDLIEVVLLYPDLLDQLLTSAGIGAIVGRAGAGTIVLGRGGGTLHIGDGQELADSPHPLAQFGDVIYVSNQVHRLAHFPHAGDLIVLGEVQDDGKMVTFEQQVATHGGLGGPQGRPFIAWPPERQLAPETLNDAEDLYPYFMSHYQPHVSDQEPVPAT